jgi:hypothetical protein
MSAEQMLEADMGAQLPVKRLRIIFASQAVIQASIGHVFIH